MTDTRSIWAHNAPKAGAPLARDATTDVCVVGGGIAGITTAYHLLATGRAVTVLDAATPGGGETAHTTAHLAWVLDDRFARLVDVRGADVARLAASSHQSAIADIERIARDERIDCDFARVPGYLFAGAGGPKALEGEQEAARALGLEHAAVDAVPVCGARCAARGGFGSPAKPGSTRRST